MLKIIPFAHQLIRETTNLGDVVVDATCGNGHDTLFLCQLVGNSGHVYAFDVQEQAIKKTQARLESYPNCVTYIHDSHAKINQYMPQSLKGQLSAAIFNLGYLPGSDKTIITNSDSTTQAIENLLPYLKQGGRIVIVIYHGHDGGHNEKEAILHYIKQLNQTYYEVVSYQFLNQQNTPPFVVAIEKK